MDKETFKAVLTYGRCDGAHCGKDTPALDMHTCPFAEDIHNDRRFLCNCCERCTFQCAMDI